VTELFDDVAGRLQRLIGRFELDAQRASISRCYQTLCGESLRSSAWPNGAGFSRINADGTPFQFAVTLAPQAAALQFLGEAGSAALSGAERLQHNRERMAQIADALDCRTSLPLVDDIIRTLAPASDPELLADPAGALWVGVGFAREAQPQVKVYLNAAWSRPARMWANLRRFAAYFAASARWEAVERLVGDSLRPLGMAIRFRADEAPTGRIYLTGFGQLLSFYARLLHESENADLARSLARISPVLLENEHEYPTASVVCSFGLHVRGAFDAKVEFCGHCLFPSDAEAARRLRRGLHVTGIDSAAYDDMVDVLGDSDLSEQRVDLHGHVGLGSCDGRPYASIYLKPAYVLA
jgi:hypothetical protein